MSAPVVTVLGLGEAGGRLAADLVSAGVEVHGYDPLITSAPQHVTRSDDPVAAVSTAEVVLALTTASTALAAAEAALPGLRPGAVYADLNTASPGLKRDIAALVVAAGARFADVALLGPVPAHGLATPALASGIGAQAFADAFGPLGMRVEVVSSRPGDAATLKLLRSVFMKGLAASALESLRAADALGQASWLEREIAAVIGEPLLERLVDGSRRHAARRVDEMEAARALLLELGIEPRIAGASAAVLAELAAVPPETGVRLHSMSTQPDVVTSPSDRARALVQGGYDLHVHVAPDVPKRRIDDRALAQRFFELGLAGFALKSHYTSTAERAQVISALHPDVDVVGTLTLNCAVGGMNALAVEIAAREGARIVWMPTVDSPAETAGRAEPREGDKVPQWARLQHELRTLGLSVEAVHVTDSDGQLLPEAREVVRAIARHGLILATGHLARDDTFAIVDAALDEGVADIVVTHPEFPCQDFSIEDQQALAARGCVLERCLTTPFSGKTTWEHVFDGVRAVGVEHTLFSSDCGNPDYPRVEDGIALWADRLLDDGFGEDDVHEMIVGQSRRLAGAA